MKKIFFIILSSLLILACFTSSISAERTLPLVVDDADILTAHEQASLESMLENIGRSHNMEIAVVTVNSTNGKSAMDYADDFYDYNGYGYGEDDDGVLLLIDMGAREWHITTHGSGTYYLDDYALYMIENAFIDDLSEGNYFAAFSTFAGMCDSYITSAKYASDSGTSSDHYTDTPTTSFWDDDYYYDDYEEHDSGGFSFDFILPSIIVGFIVSFIMVSIMKSGMKTVRSANSASDYMVNGSLSLRSQSDRYLYSNTVRTRRDTSSHTGGHHGSRGGFGGGSSVHRSSSGRSHGGRGGRF